MAKKSEITKLQEKKTTEFESLPLLPRSAWHSQLTYLKVLLKAKQALDKSESLFRQEQ